MDAEPMRRRSPNSSLLFLVDHLLRLTEHDARLLLHLAEHELPSAPHHEVELVARDPRVRLEHAISADPIPPRRTPLGARARTSCSHVLTLRREIAREYV